MLMKGNMMAIGVVDSQFKCVDGGYAYMWYVQLQFC